VNGEFAVTVERLQFVLHRRRNNISNSSRNNSFLTSTCGIIRP